MTAQVSSGEVDRRHGNKKLEQRGYLRNLIILFPKIQARI